MAYLDDVTNILEIRPNGLPTVVRLSQNENGRKLYFRLTGNETAIPSGVTVTISGTKPDGVVYSASGSITNDVVLINENTQLTAVAGTWDAKIKIVSSGQTIATGRVRFEIDADTVAPGSVPSDSELEGLVAEAQAYAENARSAAYGSPLTASTVAGMTDHTRVYVYTGSETGYTAGNWYYWNGSAWTSGGVYNSTALQTDTTLAIPGMAADAKAAGDAIGDLDDRQTVSEGEITQIKSDLEDIIGGEEQQEITDWIYGTWINTGNAVEIGDTVDITNLTEWYSLKHVIVECQEGDKFLLDITGATNARAYAFLTSANVLISRSDAGEAISGQIIAPQNAGKVIIQGVYRQSPDDTTTDNGKAYKIVGGTGNVVRFDIVQDNTEEEKARARENIGINSLEGAYISYDSEQDLTDEEIVQAQKNIGLIETVTEKEDLITTVPTNGQTLFTSSDVSVGDNLLYHIKMTIDDMAYIGLYNSQNNIIAYYGKYIYGPTGNFDGEFQIPTGFSYAKWITNMPNAQEFTLTKVIGESDVPVYGNAVRYDIEQELTDNQKSVARANIGASSGGEVDLEEPFFTDVPMLYITGTLPTAKSQGELPVMLTYKSRTDEFTSYATLKVQGDSTSGLPKKNFTIKLYKDAQRTTKDKRQFKNWSKHNKFVIKANYRELTHARNVVGARIWYDMVKSRSDYYDLPTEMLESDHLACIDGFPVMMYVNGQYYGRYAFNITKDDMLNMDDSNPDHAMVQGQGYDAGTRFEEPITTNWSDELTDDLTHVETRWKQILSFVGTSSDADFKANLENYFSVPSLIDFYLFGAALFSYDSYGKNQSYLTYDGSYFICSAYDMDLTLGLHVSGHFALGATEPWLPYYGIEWTDQIGGHNSTFSYIANRLFYKLATQFDTEIKTRWAELRAHGGALSFENLDKRYVEWCSLVTTEQMAEDYASTTASGAFTGMSNVDGGNASTNNIRQIVKYIYDRLTYLDSVFV